MSSNLPVCIQVNGMYLKGSLRGSSFIVTLTFFILAVLALVHNTRCASVARPSSLPERRCSRAEAHVTTPWGARSLSPYHSTTHHWHFFYHNFEQGIPFFFSFNTSTITLLNNLSQNHFRYTAITNFLWCFGERW